jgi:hypothetical protein
VKLNKASSELMLESMVEEKDGRKNSEEALSK